MWSRFGGKDASQVLKETQEIKKLQLICTDCETCIEFIPNAFRMEICRKCKHPANSHVPIEQLPGPRAREVRRRRESERRMSSKVLRKQRVQDNKEIGKRLSVKDSSESESDDSDSDEDPADVARRKELEVERKKAHSAVSKQMFLAFKAVDMPRVISIIESTIDRDMVDYEDPYGNTPLIVAARAGLYRSVRKIIILGADRNFENKFGITPLIAAVQSNSTKTCQELLSRAYPSDPASTIWVTELGKTCRDYVSENPKAREKVLRVLDSAPQVKAQKILDMELAEQERRIAAAAKRVVDLREKKEVELLEQIGLLGEELAAQGEETDAVALWEMEEKKLLLDQEREIIATHGLDAAEHGRSTGERLLYRMARAAKSTRLFSRPAAFEQDSLAEEDDKARVAREAKEAALSARKRRRTRHSGMRASGVLTALWPQRTCPPPTQHEAASRIQRLAPRFLHRLAAARAEAARLARARELQRANAAAVRIQRQARVLRDRRRVARRRKEVAAALRVQSVWRGRRERAAFRVLLALHRREKAAEYRQEEALYHATERETWAVRVMQRAVRRHRHVNGFLGAMTKGRAVLLLQRVLRGRVLGPLQVARRRQEIALRRLLADTLALRPVARVLELKNQLPAAAVLQRLLRPLARRAHQDRLWPSAVAVQRVARGFLGRRRAREAARVRHLRLGLLEGCMRVRGLVAAPGGGGQPRLGPGVSHGYCGKCACRRFQPREPGPLGGIARPSVLHICGCGHHVTNHAVGAMRLAVPDRYQPDQDRVVPFRTEFHQGRLAPTSLCKPGQEWKPTDQVRGGLGRRVEALEAPLPDPGFPKSQSVHARQMRRVAAERRDQRSKAKEKVRVEEEVRAAWARRSKVLEEERARLAEKNDRYIDEVEVKKGRRQAMRWSELERKREKKAIQLRNAMEAKKAREEQHRQHLQVVLEQKEALLWKQQQVALERKYRKKKRDILHGMQGCRHTKPLKATKATMKIEHEWANKSRDVKPVIRQGNTLKQNNSRICTVNRNGGEKLVLSSNEDTRGRKTHLSSTKGKRRANRRCPKQEDTVLLKEQSTKPIRERGGDSTNLRARSMNEAVKSTTHSDDDSEYQASLNPIATHQLNITQARLIKKLLSSPTSAPQFATSVTLSSKELSVSSGKYDFKRQKGEAAGMKYNFEIPLHDGTQTLVFGRSRQCDVSFDSRNHENIVSKKHLKISFTRDRTGLTVTFVDLNSTNGTTVNNQKLPSGASWKASTRLDEIMEKNVLGKTLAVSQMGRGAYGVTIAVCLVMKSNQK